MSVSKLTQPFLIHSTDAHGVVLRGARLPRVAHARSVWALVFNHFGSEIRFLLLTSSVNIYFVLPVGQALRWFAHVCLVPGGSGWNGGAVVSLGGRGTVWSSVQPGELLGSGWATGGPRAFGTGMHWIIS